MAAAQPDILVVGAQHHLLTLLQHVALIVKAGVEGRLFAAPADGLDLLQLVRQHQQVIAAGKQVALEVRPQTVADDGNIAVVHQMHQIVDLLLGEELGLVHDDAGVFLQLLVGHCLHLVEVDAGVLQADAGGHHVVAVPCVQLGFYQQGFLTPLLVVEAGHQRVGAFAGAHGSVFEVKLCHCVFLLLYLLSFWGFVKRG